MAGPSPVPGWVVISSERHVRALYDLDEPTARELGAFAARVMRAQRQALGAEHAYAFAIGDVLRHFHLHLVPRYRDTPPASVGPGRLRGLRPAHSPRRGAGGRGPDPRRGAGLRP